MPCDKTMELSNIFCDKKSMLENIAKAGRMHSLSVVLSVLLFVLFRCENSLLEHKRLKYGTPNTFKLFFVFVQNPLEDCCISNGSNPSLPIMSARSKQYLSAPPA